MEQLQTIICIYGGLGILCCLCTIIKLNKQSKQCKQKNDFTPLKKTFFQFIAIFLLIMAALVLHLSCLIGTFSGTWPILVLLGLMVVGIFIL